MIKKVDNLGRIVLPVEVRKQLNIELGEALFMDIVDGKIILSRQVSSCALCGREGGALYRVGPRSICKDCLEEVRRLDV